MTDVSDKVIHDKDYYNGAYISALEVLSVVKCFYRPKTIVDIGGGIGAWTKAASEIFKTPMVYFIDEACSKEDEEEENGMKYDLTKPIAFENRFDLVICLETAEHLPEDKSNVLVESLIEASDFILFSAAIPGQGGHGHINEQIPRYWAAKFHNRGYLPVDFVRKRIWKNDKVCWWYKQNIIPYIKREVVVDNDSLMREYTESILERLLIIHPACSTKSTSDYRFL